MRVVTFCLRQFFYSYLLMEYQLKKEQILGGVEYSNLLTFSLVQNKLERNFKAIVEALLLTQTKTDDLISKTDQLEDKMALDNKKNSHEQETVKQILKQFDNRISNLQASLSSHISEAKPHQELSSSKSVKVSEKEDNTSKKQTALVEPPAVIDKSSLYDKKIEDLEHQIALIKDKMPTLQLMQDQFDGMKRQITTLKGQLMALNSKSVKSIKRDSLSNNLNLNNFKRESLAKMGRSSVLSQSNSTVKLVNDLENKENKEERENKEKRSSKVVEEKDILGKIQEGQKNDSELEKEIEGLHVEVNTLNLFYDELKLLVEDLRKRDIKQNSSISELEEKQKRMQDQMRRDFQNMEKQLKVIQVNILNSSTPSQNQEKGKESESEEKKSPKAGRVKTPPSSESCEMTGEGMMACKRQLTDKLANLQASLQGFVTESEFNRFKGESREKQEELERKLSKLEGEFQEEIKKIYDMLINKDLDINRLGQMINSTQEVIKENAAQADRKHNIAMARIQELKKNLQNLRQDVEFYQAMNTQTKEKTTEADKSPEKESDTVVIQREKLIDAKALQDLKRNFNNKMHDQRAYLIGLVRDLEKKQNAASGVSQQIANIWDKLTEIGLFLGRKADADDIKKNIAYLQKKINRLSALVLKSEDNTEDARVARANWFCLSCDKNLLGYHGKIGRHVVWDQMPLKGMVKTTIEKKGLPSLKGK